MDNDDFDDALSMDQVDGLREETLTELDQYKLDVANRLYELALEREAKANE